jgi:hypothetical protein
MRRSNFALRLQPSLLEEARKAAESEGVALNQLINVAVAEKVSALRTQEYFRARASRANRNETFRILGRAGKNNPPEAGDKLDTDEASRRAGKKPQQKASARNSETRKGVRKKPSGSMFSR